MREGADVKGAVREECWWTLEPTYQRTTPSARVCGLTGTRMCVATLPGSPLDKLAWRLRISPQKQPAENQKPKKPGQPEPGLEGQGEKKTRCLAMDEHVHPTTAHFGARTWRVCVAIRATQEFQQNSTLASRTLGVKASRHR